MAHLRWNESVWDRVQRVALWTLGIAGAANELFAITSPRGPVVYPIIGGLLGLPFAQAWDRGRVERRQRQSQDDPGARP